MNESYRLGRNFGAIGAAQLYSQVLTLIVSLFLARSLGVEQYGVFIFGLTFPSWFLLFISLGMNSVLTIDVAADRSRANSYVTALAVMRLPLAVAAIAALWVSVHLILSDPFARTVTMILGLAGIVGTYSTTFRGVFRAFERLEYAALVTIVERTITTVSVIALLLLGFGLLEVALVFLFGSVVSLSLLLALSSRRFVQFERRVDGATVKGILRKTTPFALAGVVGTFMYSSGAVLLTILQDPTATGHFNAAFALALALVAPLTIYNLVILPVMSRLYSETPTMLSTVLLRTQKLFLMLALPAALGGWFYAEEIMVLFYGSAFVDSARSFEVLVFTVAIASAVLGLHTALAATGHQKLNLLFGTVGTGTNVALCLALIPVLGHVGAAYAFLTARLVNAGLRLGAVNRLVARVDLGSTLPRPIIAGLTMLLVLFLFPALPFWLGILTGALVYFVVLFSTRGMTREDLSLVREALRGALFR